MPAASGDWMHAANIKPELEVLRVDGSTRLVHT